jgi:hypothetical protein
LAIDPSGSFANRHPQIANRHPQIANRHSQIANPKAGDGNRTHITSLEGWSFAIKLHPQAFAICDFGLAIDPGGSFVNRHPQIANRHSQIANL